MAWDTARTQQLLLDAGARQFAAHGFAGATMDAIGRDAGVNKERVYQYFGHKRGLFDAVLADRLGGLLEAVGDIPPDPEGIGAYAGALFDRLAERPDLARLLAWESLQLDEPADALARAEACAAKVDEVASALPDLRPDIAAQLLLSLVTLVVGWWTLASVTHMIAPGSSAADRRAELVTQATALARAAG